MKLGIMQPYFFPYLGYFSLIRRTDQWIVFDTAQFIRHGWVNRNRILHPNDGWQYILAPVRKHSRETPIAQIELDNRQDWRGRLLGQLVHYKKQAPFYADTVAFLEQALAFQTDSLAEMNVHLLAAVCRRLRIPFNPRFFSAMDLPLGPIAGPGDWALRISQALGAAEYINPPGGAALFDPDAFARAGIRLTINPYEPLVYPCGRYAFEPGLSVIDAMLWNPVERLADHLAAAPLPAAA